MAVLSLSCLSHDLVTAPPPDKKRRITPHSAPYIATVASPGFCLFSPVCACFLCTLSPPSDCASSLPPPPPPPSSRRRCTKADFRHRQNPSYPAPPSKVIIAGFGSGIIVRNVAAGRCTFRWDLKKWRFLQTTPPKPPNADHLTSYSNLPRPPVYPPLHTPPHSPKYSSTNVLMRNCSS